jgi:hypothetical protein
LEASLTSPPYATSAIGETRRDGQSPPLRGRCLARQRGCEGRGISCLRSRAVRRLRGWRSAGASRRLGRLPFSRAPLRCASREVGLAACGRISLPDICPSPILATPGFHRLAIVSVGKRGALSVPLYFFLRRVHRAPPVLSPRMGGPGSFRRSRLAPGGAGGRVRRALPARPSPRPGPEVGRFPPSHATVARPTRTPSPSPTPRSGAGFPQGRWGDYAGATKGRGQNDEKHC